MRSAPQAAPRKHRHHHQLLLPPPLSPQVTTAQVHRGQEALYAYESGYWDHICELTKRKARADEQSRKRKEMERELARLKEQEMARLQETVRLACLPACMHALHACLPALLACLPAFRS
jgi:hypothetical protein